MTQFHSKYYAYELSRSGGKGVDRLGRALFDACVDLNPHQIEAALFALRSPLAKGVLLADEVGLGKTIEAGLVMCQSWAENQRKLLVICPASLRKQWAIELEEKFNLPSQIIDAKTYKDLLKAGYPNPFDINKIIICSMHFVAGKELDIRAIPWNLVVIDEAHKLRNAYRESNRIGKAVRQATLGCKKVLLTATPLQNSLLELYGLSTLIDENIFGDLSSFRTQYINYGGDLPGLRDRLLGFCWRTLRSQVSEYVPYTERKLITRPFKPSEQEHKLYQSVSEYLMRDNTYAFPARQKHLLILLIRKVLASSPTALACTLEIIKPDHELPEDQHTKLTVDGKIELAQDGTWGFRKIEGWVPSDPMKPNNGQKERVLIVWRNLTGNLEQDNLMLDEWFIKYRISAKDFEYDTIYVNGSNNLPNLKKDDENWKVHLIEEEFHKRMWETE